MKPPAAWWPGRFFPLGEWSRVEPREVQARLRRVFAQNGRPKRLRVDNGAPWGKRYDLPSALGLWLIGLGIEMIWNPPARPEKNGVVERVQGTIWRWAEPKTCRDASQLQERLEEIVTFQREVYPGEEGCSRNAIYPQLAVGGQP